MTKVKIKAETREITREGEYGNVVVRQKGNNRVLIFEFKRPKILDYPDAIEKASVYICNGRKSERHDLKGYGILDTSKMLLHTMTAFLSASGIF